MAIKLSTIEGAITPFLGLIAPQLEDQGAQLGAEVGMRLNNKIEGTVTELDDRAKAALTEFLDALSDALKVDGVVDEGFGDPEPTD